MKTFFVFLGALLLGAGALWLWQKRQLITLAEQNKDVIDLAGNIGSSVGDVKSIFSRVKAAL